MSEIKEAILRVEHLKQYFKMGKGYVKAVDDVSFNIKKGEVFGLVGESGCGKTTTGRSIIKLYSITGGDIYFKNQRISAGIFDRKDNIASAEYDNKYFEKIYSERQTNEIIKKYNNKIEAVYNLDSKKIISEVNRLRAEMNEEIRQVKKGKLMTKMQMIFQDPMASLNPRMTVREIIAEGLRIMNIKDENYIDMKVTRMLELVGLVPEHGARYPHEFSGGQRQRIGIARAVIMEPELIIADEPVSALDVSVQAQVINLLNDLRDKMNLTILFIAHNLSIVKYFSDRIGVMHLGKLVETADSDELFSHPYHPYTKSLLSAIPMPDPHYEKKRKRILYNPSYEHDYTVDKPLMQEVSDGHFVYCNKKEFDIYKRNTI